MLYRIELPKHAQKLGQWNPDLMLTLLCQSIALSMLFNSPSAPKQFRYKRFNCYSCLQKQTPPAQYLRFPLEMENVL